MDWSADNISRVIGIPWLQPWGTVKTLNEMYLKEGRLDVTVLGRGYAWLDAGTMESLYKATDFVRTIEQTQTLPVSVIEEIAYEKGWISRDKLLELVARYSKSSYGQYLIKLAKGTIITGG